ncbi:hypothetical protein [Radiobacillus deserti]|uniref:Uncharacterized protein n=1 Tax=Radiobacillus deserti TaxID=2594883 RepID=A0A516KIY5_9BACI|nr:hypothetical protein [Radiobacillus deserti]QDP41355.1 hypothetical protein FN924_14885 [Radiobacillus deserti]
MSPKQRPFLKLTVWSVVAILVFGLIEFLFVGFVGTGVGTGGQSGGGLTGVGAAVSLFNFIFVALIILAVIGLLIGLVGLTIKYFERHDIDLFEDEERDRRDDYERRRERPRRSSHR